MKNFDDIVDDFFSAIKPNEVVELFKDLGYEFELKSPYPTNSIVIHYTKKRVIESSKFYRNRELAECESEFHLPLPSDGANLSNVKYQAVLPQNLPSKNKFEFKGSDSTSKYSIAA